MTESMTAGGDCTLIDQTGHYWGSFQDDDLPADIMAMARRFLLDTLMVRIAGAGIEAATRAMRIGWEGTAGTLAIWGQARRNMPYTLAVAAESGRATIA